MNVITEQPRLKYIPALDGLRAICILSVMLHHILAPQFAMGTLGVDTFFVLSGFLITSLLAQEWQNTGNIILRRFYMRRLLRLTPALVVMILTVILIFQKFGTADQQAIIWRAAVSSLLYVSNWVAMDPTSLGLGPLGVNWSLSIEDQFYLIWPPILVFMLTRHFSRQKIIVVLGLGAVVSAILCYPLWRSTGDSMRVWEGTDTRSQTLLIGCILGLLYSWGKLPDAKTMIRLVPWAVTFIAVLIVAITYSPFDLFPIMFSGGYALFAICIAIFIAYLLLVPTSRAYSMLSWKPLVWIGRISYGLYLWHGVIFGLITHYNFNWPFPIITVVRVGLSFAAAILSYYFVERYFLQLKSRYQPTKLTPQPVTAQPSSEFSTTYQIDMTTSSLPSDIGKPVVPVV